MPSGPVVAAPAGGIPPVPHDILLAATDVYLSRGRIDMSQLAGTLGISRPTLWRRVGSRDRLIGEVIWCQTLTAVASALAAARGTTGTERVITAVARFLRVVSADPALHHLLETEPAVALRVLTSKHGAMQGRLIETLEALLQAERERGMVIAVEPEVLAYAIVRLGESFLYADVIADHDPDVETAVRLVSGLVRGNAVDG